MTRRAEEILKRLPDGKVTGAEIGVFNGKTSVKLLQRDDLVLCMVDTWKGFHIYPMIVIATHEEQEENYREAMRNTEFAKDRRKVLRLPSLEAAELIEDGTLDFVFIDADHSFIAVQADIRAWTPKIKRGGLLCGHDYANPDYAFGDEVKRAVDEAVKRHGWTLEIGPDFTWFVKL